MIIASVRARKLLRDKYKDEHRKLYLEVLKDVDFNVLNSKESLGVRSRATSKAVTLLTHNHWEDYQKFYVQAIKEGCPRSYYCK
jgi:hypothetical protein